MFLVGFVLSLETDLRGWLLVARNLARSQSPCESHRARFWVQSCSWRISMTFLRTLYPRSIYFLTIWQYILPLKASTTAWFCKTILIYCLCGCLSGPWNSTPQSVRWCRWQAPKSQSNPNTNCMVRCWRLLPVPSTWTLTYQVTCPSPPT